MDQSSTNDKKDTLVWRPKPKMSSLWDKLPLHLQEDILARASAFNGKSSFARRRKAKRLGWCKSCLSETCPGLQPLSDYGRPFMVYYCTPRSYQDRARLYGKDPPQ